MPTTGTHGNAQVGDKYLCINTAHHEEKENALNMLTCYVDHLKEHFAPYCLAVAERVEHVLAVPVLNNGDMRKTAAALVPGLVNDVQLARARGSWPDATPEYIRDLFIRLVKALLKVRVPSPLTRSFAGRCPPSDPSVPVGPERSFNPHPSPPCPFSCTHFPSPLLSSSHHLPCHHGHSCASH